MRNLSSPKEISFRLNYEDIHEDRTHIHQRTGYERSLDFISRTAHRSLTVVPHIKNITQEVGGYMTFALLVVAFVIVCAAAAVWVVLREISNYLRDLAHPFLKETTAEWERKYGSADGTDVLAHLRKPAKRVTRKKQ